MQIAYTAAKAFTGMEWITDTAIVVNNGVIEKLVPLSEVTNSLPVQNFSDCLLVPAFIDAQVYGAAGKLLAAYPVAETLQVMSEEFLKSGTVLCVPTIATNTTSVFKQCIDAVKTYWSKGGKGIHGLHLEGPWINAEKRGAHIEEWIHVPDAQKVKDLLEYGKGIVRMITLAPEICSKEIVNLIRSYGIVISAGHSNATYEEATESFDSGIATATHLYNAMSPLQHRKPGMVGAILDHNKVMASIIADGHHVDFSAVRIAKKIMKERLFAITDAVTETGIGPYKHQRAGNKYESNGILSGSALSMYKAMINLVHEVGIDVGEALRMCSLYPAQVLDCHDNYGKIAPRYKAQLIVLDKELKFKQVIASY